MSARIYPLLFVFLFLSTLTFSQLALEFDINTKPAGSEPGPFTELEGKIYFGADNTTYGRELWVYDPSSGITERISDIEPDAAASVGSDEMYAIDGRLYFNVKTRPYYYEPSSGDIIRLDASGARFAYNFKAFNGKIYFTASQSGSNTFLFEYDPATNEAEVIVDINPNVNNDTVGSYFIYQGKIYFIGNDQVNGSQLWTYDPSDEAIERITDVAPTGGGGGFNSGIVYQDKLYYSGKIDDPINFEFYELNLTTLDIRLVAEIRPGAQSSDITNTFLVADEIYFLAKPGPGGTYYNYVYDITNDEVTQLDFSALTVTLFGCEALRNGKIIGTGSSDDYGYELFELDVDTKEISLVEDITPGTEGTPITWSLLVGDDYYYGAFRNDVDDEFFKYNFIADEVSLLKDINITTASSEPLEFTPYDGKLYFSAEEQNTGRELWVYDPQSGTTSLVIDFMPGITSSNPAFFMVFEDKLFFRERFAIGDAALGYYDSATNDITRLDEEVGGENPISPENLQILNGELYFSGRDDNGDDGLYKYDPIAASIERLLDIKVRNSFVHNERLYIGHEDDDDLGAELYYYDDSNNELVLIEDINPGEGDSYPDLFTVFENKIFFTAYNEVTSYELYSYDPVTEALKLYAFSNNNTNINTLAVYDGHLYFSAAEFGSDVELYRLNNDTETLELVQDIVPGNSGSWPRQMITFNDKLIFTVAVPEFGRELWEYDSTTDTAMIVADIWPGISPSDPFSLTLFNDKLYFSANNGTQGDEIWSLAECLNAFLTTTPDIDNSGNGTIDLSVSGGTPPYDYMWSNDAQTEDIDGLVEGIYSVTINDQTGCLTTLEGRIDFASNIKIPLDQSIEIYPNPASGFIIIAQEGEAFNRINVLDVYGRRIWSDIPMEQQLNLNLNALGEGIYFIEFLSKEKTTAIRRLILTR